MHTLQIRNLPTDVYEALKASAKASKRSMTQEAIEAIEQFLGHQKKDELSRKMKSFERIQELHKTHPLPKVALEWIKEDQK